MAQSIQTNGSLEGAYSIQFTTITVTVNGVSYSYSSPPRRKINAIYDVADPSLNFGIMLALE